MTEIRKEFGLCCQKDILYPTLTAEEHLRYFQKIKRGAADQREIEDIIQKVGLQEERAKESQHLSGGNKRKLSLGISLIGNSKIIFLDEPTSGMDPVSRKNLWDTLKQIKDQNRTVILTTHHLEEAEHLADQIAVLQKGELFALGSTRFIKEKFGIGYILTISPLGSTAEQRDTFLQKSDLYKQVVKRHISTSLQDEKGGTSSQKWILPFE